MADFAARRSVVAAARRLVDAGLTQGTSGNVSVRTAGGLLITPSGMPYGEMEAPDLVERLLCGGEADPLEGPARERLQPFQGQGEVASALVAHERVDLVDDRGLDRGQHRAPGPRGEQQVQRLGGGDQDVRRPARHRRALQGMRKGVIRLAGTVAPRLVQR